MRQLPTCHVIIREEINLINYHLNVQRAGLRQSLIFFILKNKFYNVRKEYKHHWFYRLLRSCDFFFPKKFSILTWMNFLANPILCNVIIRKQRKSASGVLKRCILDFIIITYPDCKDWNPVPLTLGSSGNMPKHEFLYIYFQWYKEVGIGGGFKLWFDKNNKQPQISLAWNSEGRSMSTQSWW